MQFSSAWKTVTQAWIQLDIYSISFTKCVRTLQILFIFCALKKLHLWCCNAMMYSFCRKRGGKEGVVDKWVYALFSPLLHIHQNWILWGDVGKCHRFQECCWCVLLQTHVKSINSLTSSKIVEGFCQWKKSSFPFMSNASQTAIV